MLNACDSNLVVALTNQSTNAAQYLWEFGDGTRQFSLGGPAPVSHTFSAAGSYTASMTIVDRLGNLEKYTQTVIVGPDAGGGSLILTTPPRASAARAHGGRRRHHHHRHHHRPSHIRILQAFF